MVKALIKNLLHKNGIEIKRVKNSKKSVNTSLSMFGAMERCIKRGLNAKTIIDIGASDGRWTKECLSHLPNSNYLLIEAQSPHEESLIKLKEKNSNVDYIVAAAGREKGKIYFDNTALLGGVASEKPFKENCIEVPVISVDDEIKSRNLPGPYVLKLDTHGFEIPILEGAKKTIQNSELIIIEVYNFKISDESLFFYQLCEYMASLGFSPIEMADPMLRDYDDSFWQMDIFFIKSKRKEFTYTSFD